MMHSHTAIAHLVKRAEQMAQRRQKKDRKPLWLSNFIDQTAELFEPETEAARVGFECHFADDHWQVHFYLGDVEILGGRFDGQRQRIAFDFDVKALLGSFETVTGLRNRTLSDVDATAEDERTMIEIDGQLSDQFGGHRLTVGILSRPPQAVGPGMRILPNGEIEAV